MKFTPIDNFTNKRLDLEIHETDIPRGRIQTFYVTEKGSEKTYKCKTKSCGLPNCICDSWIYHYNQ